MPATYVQYGAYQFPAGQVDVSLNKLTRYNSRQRPQAEIWTMALSGTLIADGQAACNTAARLLEEAFAIPDQTLAVYLGNGTQSVHKLDAASSLSGVQIVQPPSFPTGSGAEMATGRTFSLSARAEYVVQGADSLVSWQEEISVRGDGGPAYALMPVAFGPPQLHVIHEQTPVYVTQQGSAVGWLARPTAPPPINWGVRLGDRTTGSVLSPNRVATGFRNYPIRWSYQFVNTTPDGVPYPTQQ